MDSQVNRETIGEKKQKRGRFAFYYYIFGFIFSMIFILTACYIFKYNLYSLLRTAHRYEIIST